MADGVLTTPARGVDLRPEPSTLVDAVISGAAAAAAIAILVMVAVDGPLEIAGDWLVVDRAAAAWTVFATVIVVAIRAFAHRQLAADPARRHFRRASVVAAVSAVALFWAGNLVALALAAVVSSLAAAALVDGRGPRRPVARRMRRVLGAGDLALVTGVVLVVVDSDGIAFAELARTDGAVMHLASCLVVVAALARCSQVPAHGWLPRTLVAPTPVSALLHAGLVNAGGVIAIRFAPLVARSTGATAVGIVAATASMVVGVAIMRGRSEVKTALVWSTTAQMGFMIVQVLVGLGAAAAAHLIAHGAYKSNLFLTSGSTLERPVRSIPVRTPAHRVVAGALTAAVTWSAVWVAGYDVDAHGGAAWLLVAFVALTVFALLDAPNGVARGLSLRAVVALVGLAAAATVYLELISRFEHWLALPLPDPDGAVGWVVAVIVAVVVGAAATGDHGTSLPASDLIRARLIAAARRPALDTVADGNP